MAGVVGEAWVLPDVVEPDRVARLQQQAQHAVAAGQLADQRRLRLVDPHRQEAIEAPPPVGDAERGVAGLSQRLRAVEHVAQDLVEVGVPGQREQVDGVLGDALGFVRRDRGAGFELRARWRRR
jgi:hypothetical protein